MSKNNITDLKHNWQSIGRRDLTKNELLQFQLYHKFLKLFQINESYCFVFLPGISEIEYCSDNVLQLLGYTPEEFTIEVFLQSIHPDDFPTFMRFERAVVTFKKKLPVSELMNYKSRYNYRIRKKDGNYITIMQQSITIESDQEGSILRNFVIHTDISDIKTDSSMSLSFINIAEGQSFFNVENNLEEYATEDAKLTPREREIVSYIAQNYTSQQIAEALHISKDTVSTHRKNIHSKTGTHNALELVVKALENGWINSH